MNDDPMSIAKFLPDHLAERTRDLNRLAFNDDGEFVLYWMHHAVRGHENPALDTAVFVAGRLGLPVLNFAISSAGACSGAWTALKAR